eukprot:4829784-Pleurochrysis_carterae.AAC.1
MPRMRSACSAEQWSAPSRISLRPPTAFSLTCINTRAWAVLFAELGRRQQHATMLSIDNKSAMTWPTTRTPPADQTHRPQAFLRAQEGRIPKDHRPLRAHRGQHGGLLHEAAAATTFLPAARYHY